MIPPAKSGSPNSRKIFNKVQQPNQLGGIDRHAEL
jgi:hypothetical protein